MVPAQIPNSVMRKIKAANVPPAQAKSHGSSLAMKPQRTPHAAHAGRDTLGRIMTMAAPPVPPPGVANVPPIGPVQKPSAPMAKVTMAKPPVARPPINIPPSQNPLPQQPPINALGVPGAKY